MLSVFRRVVVISRRWVDIGLMVRRLLVDNERVKGQRVVAGRFVASRTVSW